MIATLAFYVFAAVTVGAAVMVISAKNPIHSVLFLILAFFSSAGLFVLLGAEFIAMILIIVYVGAVAVLFLFVVMMLDIDFVALREGFLEYLPMGAVVGLILLAEIIMVVASRVVSPETAIGPGAKPTPDLNEVTNTEALGQLIYTDYIYVFQASGMILLVAMIGAIVLTHRKRKGVKKQVIADQVARTSKEAIKIIKVESGQGL